MGVIASQITSFTVVYSIPGEFPAQWPVTRKMFPFDDVIMIMQQAIFNGVHSLLYKANSATCQIPTVTHYPPM